MGIANSIGEQFQQPRGWVGRIVGRMMTRMTAPFVTWTVDLLAVEPTDQLLEVDFGGGEGIKKLAARASEGHVTGVDVSEAMLSAGAKRNAASSGEGRVDAADTDGTARQLLGSTSSV